MRILAVETSCDETALAVVDCSGGIENPSARIIENLVASQTATHAPFGGVVPNLAKREHIKNLPELYTKLAASPRARLENIDVVAVTVGPGLEPALWTGIEFAKNVARELGKPLLGANHLEGHLWSFLLNRSRTTTTRTLFPAVALIVSGGHTILVSVPSFSRTKKLGETRDDAAGEAFDKVARLLDLPYPGGPEIERLAKIGNPRAIPFPRPMINTKTYDVSFSGLKTSVLYYLRDTRAPETKNTRGRGSSAALKRAGERAASEAPPVTKADVAASFQAAVIETLLAKTLRAVREYGAKTILVSGGVSANRTLQASFRSAARREGIACVLPPRELHTDNAAMIAVAAYVNTLNSKKYRIAAESNLNL